MSIYERFLHGDGMIGVLQRTLDAVDSRLVQHGTRVAFLLYRMLCATGEYSQKEIRDLSLLAMVHDIGAYKMEHIDEILKFETKNYWNHSVFGYLFLRHFSFLAPYSTAVLLHHASYSLLQKMEDLPAPLARLAQLLNIADRADVFCFVEGGSMQEFVALLPNYSGTLYDPEVISLFCSTVQTGSFEEALESNTDFVNFATTEHFSPNEIDMGLRMLVFTIDFRSTYTVTHTITTASIGIQLARRFGLRGEALREIRAGALLHDLGKIGIPVEILEYPGKLSAQAMSVMRTHVDLTDKILGNSVAPAVRDIALRHHEKLDGSGYPRGLTGESLTLSQRILAVADIVSALRGTRSYKDSFSKEKTLRILREGADDGKLDKQVVSTMEKSYDDIMHAVDLVCAPVLDDYEAIWRDYDKLLRELNAYIETIHD